MFLNTLSGRFLLLTTLFVMLAEVLIFVPSIARFREDYLLLRLERAQIASLALLANDGMVSDSLEKELLANAGVLNVVLRRDAVRQLVLSSPIPKPIYATYDLRDAGPFQLISDAMAVLVDPADRIIRVIGNPVNACGPADRGHDRNRAAAQGDDRIRAAHPCAVGDHLGDDGGAAVRCGAPPAGGADQAGGEPYDRLCRGARGCATGDRAHRLRHRAARGGGGAAIAADGS